MASDPFDLTPPSGHTTGLLPRDYKSFPVGCFSFAEPFPDSLLVPQDEIQDRIDYFTEQKASLLDLREKNYETLRSLDQDGEPLCWSFSSTKAMMYLRAVMNQPLIRMSAWWVAGRVMNWRSSGGWGGESLKKIVSEGVPEEKFCPSYSSRHDTADTRANAALHKCTEWWEGSEDSEKALHQSVSAFLMGLPTIEDFNHMSHSMCCIWMKSWKGKKRKVADNSWGSDSGDNGLYYLDDWKAQPNGLWIPRVQTASLV